MLWKLQPHHQPLPLYWLPCSQRLVHCFTAPLSWIWILKSVASEQRGGLKEMEEITPVLGGLALQSVMEMSWQGAVMFWWWGVTWTHFKILMANPGGCFSYLSISKEAWPSLCLVFSFSAAKAAIEMVKQHALFIQLHVHISTVVVLFLNF